MSNKSKSKCDICKEWYNDLSHHKCETRNKIKHIAFTRSEVEIIKDHSQAGGMTQSEFIRQAVNEKINKIRNPELVKPIFNQIDSISPDLIDKLIKHTNDTVKKQGDTISKQEKMIKNLIERMDVVSNMIKVLEQIKTIPSNQDLSKETKIIIDMFKKRNKNLSVMDIINDSNLEQVEIVKILTNKENNLFKFNISTGRWSLK